MNGEQYGLIAIAMRYVFAGIMALIVARAWKITVVDSGRAASLRRLAPETGLCGEFLVVKGDGRRAREGMRYPVIREGLVGASRKADVRIRSASLRRAHAFFEMTPAGLRVRAQQRARMYNVRGEGRRELTLGDGDRVTFGKVELMLILSDGQAIPGYDKAEELFDVAPGAARVREAPAQAQDEADGRGAPAWSREAARDDGMDAWDDAPRAKQSRGGDIDGWDDAPRVKQGRDGDIDGWDDAPRKRTDSREPDAVHDSWEDLRRSKRYDPPDDLFDI